MWAFEIITGNLYADGKDLIGKGYSGAKPHVNDSDAIQIKNEGPIPPGLYSITPPHDSKHGPYSLGLIPHDGNEMFGRSDFLMHGDRIDAPGQLLASEGCIIMSRDVREAVWNSGDHILKVVTGTLS